MSGLFLILKKEGHQFTDLSIFTAMEKQSSTGRRENGQHTEIEQYRRKKDHFAFLVCVLLAALFWLLIKLSSVYSVNYPLQIRYTNEPKDYLVTQLIDSTVNINVKADGYKVLDLLLSGQLNHLNIDLNHLTPTRLKQDVYGVASKDIQEKIADYWGISESEIHFSKNMLSFKMEPLDKKRLEIVPRLNLDFKSQHGLYAVEVIPKKVLVYGPKALLDSLKNIRTEEIKLEQLSASHLTKVNLENPGAKLLRLSIDRVRVNLDVEKYTESSLVVPIDVADIHPMIRTFPTTTKVYFNIFLRDYNKIHANQFKVIPDIKNIKLKEVKKLGLKIIKQPKNVSNLRIDPNEVEFIIVN
jgi:hypothetical protein